MAPVLLQCDALGECCRMAGMPRGQAGAANARYTNVTISAREQIWSGENVSWPVPAVMPCSAAQRTAV